MLSEEKTYRTRDGSRTGIRVRPYEEGTYPWVSDKTPFRYTNKGRLSRHEQSADDLIEEQPAERPFSYDACPMHVDGRRRAVTRDGREVMLLANDAPGDFSIVGWFTNKANQVITWTASGTCLEGDDWYLLIPPPPKRVVWVNFYADGECRYFDRLSDAEGCTKRRAAGNRAYSIEIDP